MGRKSSGYTFLELMVTLAIAAIVNTMAVPYFSEFIASLRTYKAANSLRTALVAARSEALMRNTPVGVCPSSDGVNCRSTYNWQHGWITYVSTPGSPYRNQASPVIQHGKAQSGPLIIKNDSGTTVKFDTHGRIGQNGSFHICNSTSGEPALRLVLYQTGRIRSTTRGVICVS
jgi:type IV fimbrial biogenesis protein FimT